MAWCGVAVLRWSETPLLNDLCVMSMMPFFKGVHVKGGLEFERSMTDDMRHSSLHVCISTVHPCICASYHNYGTVSVNIQTQPSCAVCQTASVQTWLEATCLCHYSMCATTDLFTMTAGQIVARSAAESGNKSRVCLYPVGPAAAIARCLQKGARLRTSKGACPEGCYQHSCAGQCCRCGHSCHDQH